MLRRNFTWFHSLAIVLSIDWSLCSLNSLTQLRSFSLHKFIPTVLQRFSRNLVVQKVKRFSVIITMRSVLSPDEHWQPYFVKCLPLLVGHAIKPNRQGIQLDSPAKASYNHICWSNNFLEPLPTSCPFTYSFYTNLVSIHLQVPFALIPRSDGGIYTRFAEWKVCHSAHKKCFKNK